MIRKGDKIVVGNLSKRVTVYGNLRGSDGMGGSTVFPVGVLNTWADIVPLSADRRLTLGGIVENVSHKITMRWRDDFLEAFSVNGEINHTLYLVYKGKKFTINSVINVDERQHTVELLATAEKFDTA